jgi:predicted O-methyltransferase YrrM
MTVEEAHGPALQRIRDHCQAEGKFSWTSPQYQSDILNFVHAHGDKGRSVIEVGCYKGGLTALLAHVCRESGLHLHTMDIDPTAIASVTKLLADLKLDTAVTVHHGALSAFTAKARRGDDAVLCILDGDHAYKAVRADLQAVARLPARPYAIAFHDYSLRHPTTDERVDEAVADHFGPKAEPRLIGMRMNGEGHATAAAPQPDGHYWKVPGAEGAILVLG